jgi:high-affinity iron transporter
MLGLFPTWQSVLAQILMAVAIAIGFAWNRRGGSRTQKAASA